MFHDDVIVGFCSAINRGPNTVGPKRFADYNYHNKILKKLIFCLFADFLTKQSSKHVYHHLKSLIFEKKLKSGWKKRPT